MEHPQQPVIGVEEAGHPHEASNQEDEEAEHACQPNRGCVPVLALMEHEMDRIQSAAQVRPLSWTTGHCWGYQMVSTLEDHPTNSLFMGER